MTVGIEGPDTVLPARSASAAARAIADGAATLADPAARFRLREGAWPESSPSRGPVLRIATFTAPSPDSAIHGELRELGRHRWGRSRWVGRRLVEARRAEVAVVSIWDDDDEMTREVALGQQLLSGSMRNAIASMSTEIYACRAYGAWRRDGEPCVLRIFRGGVIEGDPATFDPPTAASYVGLFEANPSCVAIVAGIRTGGIALATLWTSWDSIVAATNGELREVLPVRLPGWAVTGSAVHYELVTAEGEWASPDATPSSGS